MSSFWKKYKEKRLLQLSNAWHKAKNMKVCYLFLLPFAILFFTFTVLPIVNSIYYGFTNFNILEKPVFIGLRNYINLFLQDEVFQIAVKNTFLIAIIAGPVGYIMAFIFAWLINELPKWVRSIIVLFCFAPSIAANAYTIFTTIFKDDAQGWINGWLIKWGFIVEPIIFFANPSNIMKLLIPIILWMSLGANFLAFVAGLKSIDKSMYEAGYIDGIQNRWQELWFITLPSMKPMLLFGAVITITNTFNVSDVPRNLAGFPSTDYAARTIVTHLFDYGFVRFEMGYASAIATVLVLIMIVSRNLFQAILNRVGK